MRIISGTHKGRRITAPKLLPVRPTTDMAKEALFNILHNQYHFEGVTVLDLFAGTGNLSYEFASRGCLHITAVDSNRKCVRFIEATAKSLALPITAVNGKVLAYLQKTPSLFDIIFADPPYDQPHGDFLKIHEIVFGRSLLREGGKLIIEHSKHTTLSGLAGFEELRKYGGSVFSFFSPNA